MISDVGDFTTAGVLIMATAFIWIAVDVYLYAVDKETISQRIHKMSTYAMGAVFLMGMLAGHWWW